MPKRNDAICGAIGMLLGVILYYGAYQIGLQEGATIGADFVPKIVAILMFLFSGFLFLQGRKGMAAEKANPPAKDYVPNYKGTAIMLVVLIAYIAIFTELGFVLSSMLYLFAALVILSKKEETNYVRFLIISVVGSLVIYFLFAYVFGIMLPEGLLDMI